jgi:hypothetical protein
MPACEFDPAMAAKADTLELQMAVLAGNNQGASINSRPIALPALSDNNNELDLELQVALFTGDGDDADANGDGGDDGDDNGDDDDYGSNSSNIPGVSPQIVF